MGGYRCGMSYMQKLAECVCSENFFVKCSCLFFYFFIFSWREVGGGGGGKVRKREERWEGSLLFTKNKKVIVNSNAFKRNLLNHNQTSVRKVETAALAIYTCSVVWSPHICFHL